MSGLVIGIDVDDVVAKLIDAWLLEYNRRSGDRLTPEELTTWEISDHVKPEWKERLFELLTGPMYDTVEPYPGTQQAVKKIRAAGHQVWFITSAWNEDLFNHKVVWLNRHGYEFDRVIGVGKWSEFKTKQEIPGVDWLIDDHIGNLTGFKGYAVLQTRPHNKALEWTGKRIRHLDDIVPSLAWKQVFPTTRIGVVNVREGTFEGEFKPTNPKDAIGGAKVPLHFVSGVVKAYAAIAHYLGNVKYGAWNYREGGARASIYLSALDRHMDKWKEGQEFDQADGTPHLANALACINILIESSENGNMVDDRPPSQINVLERVYAKVEGIMVKIQEKYKDRSPRHFTIADTK